MARHREGSTQHAHGVGDVRSSVGGAVEESSHNALILLDEGGVDFVHVGRQGIRYLLRQVLVVGTLIGLSASWYMTVHKLFDHLLDVSRLVELDLSWREREFNSKEVGQFSLVLHVPSRCELVDEVRV
jgi:hypothetical protein